MQTITLRLPDKMRRELERTSKKQSLPVSDLVRLAIKRDLALRRFRELRRQTIPYAEAAGFLTDEDVFESVS